MINVSKEPGLQAVRLELLREPVLARLHDVPPARIGELSPVEARKIVEEVINRRLSETDVEK
ncbi:MAG: hypothetical protein LVQ95_05030 [Candidatus Micrarchaeales archaeon]|nr:hypothetical protein [Candidatus Micrarchaeales archaeon]